jgi:hypothetical protein
MLALGRPFWDVFLLYNKEKEKANSFFFHYLRQNPLETIKRAALFL